ncbi:hypothetical protein WR25_23792 [Diploscapter pachys]|uniref:Uncharacterized protein n=1 Tax=Diploscapter pachys TaxID=2018661 RepID=A0A2A2M2C9_9BILA|nr:hypothetical protein WR25_23792 [Diploscapter pachys]
MTVIRSDRLAIAPRIVEAGQAVAIRAVAHAGGQIEVAGQRIGAADVDGIARRFLRQLRRSVERTIGDRHHAAAGAAGAIGERDIGRFAAAGHGAEIDVVDAPGDRKALPAHRCTEVVGDRLDADGRCRCGGAGGIGECDAVRADADRDGHRALVLPGLCRGEAEVHAVEAAARDRRGESRVCRGRGEGSGEARCGRRDATGGLGAFGGAECGRDGDAGSDQRSRHQHSHRTPTGTLRKHKQSPRLPLQRA